MRCADGCVDVDKLDAEQMLTRLLRSLACWATRYVERAQLPPMSGHAPARPAESTALFYLPHASAASAPCNTLLPPAGPVRVASLAALHSCMPSTQGGYRQQVRSCCYDDDWDNAGPPRKEVNTKMYGKDADTNLLARKSLSQCKKDPGDVYARCCLARCIP
jgi:hypothetical protein